MPRKHNTSLIAAQFDRPLSGPVYSDASGEYPFTNLPAWQSNGGPNRGHPARALPFTLDIPVLASQSIERIHIVGVLALYADRASEASGTLGASLQLVDERGTNFRHDLINGRHYADARDLNPISQLNGDGSSLVTVGQSEVGGTGVRVDVLSIDIPEDCTGSSIRLKDLGSPASFVVFDVFLEIAADGPGCPFHSGSGGISLGEIASIVRVGDRVNLVQALDQLESSLLLAEDLDEARGQALTFIAMVTAATLEMGASRAMHRVQLDAAREMDSQSDPATIAATARRYVESVASFMFREQQSPSSYLVDRALAIVERHFAKDLTDAAVAAQLGLSTSHFRFLFKEATGQPFHKYLVALRLEKARRLLIEDEMAVSAVAKAVGFAGLSHFSRAFTQRFSVSPTHIRRSVG